MSDDEAEAVTNLGAVVAAQQAEIERLRGGHSGDLQLLTETIENLKGQMATLRTRAEQAEAEVERLSALWNDASDWRKEWEEARAQIAAMQAAMVEAVIRGLKIGETWVVEPLAPFLPKQKAGD